MNAAQIHLALNHFPIVLVFVGVSLLALSLVRKSSELRSVAAGLLVLAAAATVPVFVSGEPTEEVVEHRSGVSEVAIHAHEEAAELSLILAAFLGVAVAANWLIERKKKVRPVVWWFVVTFGLLNFAAFARTAHLGGLIRHDELRVVFLSGSSEPGNKLHRTSETEDD